MKAHETDFFRPQPLRNETAAEEAAHKKLFFKKVKDKVAKVAQHYISLTNVLGGSSADRPAMEISTSHAISKLRQSQESLQDQHSEHLQPEPGTASL
jgi:hypothetical protein